MCLAPEIDLTVHQLTDNEQPRLLPQLLQLFQRLELRKQNSCVIPVQSGGGTAVKQFPVGHKDHSRAYPHSKWGCAQREPLPCNKTQCGTSQVPSWQMGKQSKELQQSQQPAVTAGDPSELPVGW